ncbi:MAG: TfoX/Sxy family protein [Pseudomonadota bacterium]|nr:TfoX/Sxy family protein [Pseudomonadota bacterium]
MAFDEGEAEILRTDLHGLKGLTEKRMFGGLCFFQHGNMIGGARGGGEGGALFRVGKENVRAAVAEPGVTPMEMGGRTMGGYVAVTSEALADDMIRLKLLDMALTFTATLPPK